MNSELEFVRSLNDDKVEAACTLLDTGNRHFEVRKIIDETNGIFLHL